MPNRISGKIQHYAWGGFDYIPSLLNIENKDKQPFAEYWLGAHPKAPSTISSGEKTNLSLDQLIAKNPEFYLGRETTKRFGRLPYLFKVLDVRKMLSIQVHPTKVEAERGFDRENAAKIPLDAPNRNYKDDNHKPEMMVALSPFYLLHGFLEKAALEKRLTKTVELATLLPTFRKEGYKGLYETIMKMPQERVNQMLSPMLNRLEPLYKESRLQKTDPGFWAARALVSGMCSRENIDRGIFSIYFFNILHLKKGEAIFQAAGIPHAYLEGQNIELMANSDNVLRGGLTPKHVNVEELLQHLVFEGVHPKILKPTSDNGKTVYPCPVPDLTLEKFDLREEEQVNFQAHSLEIILLIQGECSCSEIKL